MSLTLFEYTRRIAYNNVIHALEALPGAKDLVLDDALMKPLDQIASIQILKNHGVQKVYRMDSIYNPSSKLCAFMMRPCKSNNILLQRHLIVTQTNNIETVIMYLPHANYLTDTFLESEGLLDYISRIMDLAIYIIPIELDLFSMDIISFFCQTFNFGDTTDFLNIARCLHSIQQTYGRFEQKIIFGKKSKHICDLLGVLDVNDEQISTWEEEGDGTNQQDAIPTLILIDRDVDYVTPFCTALNYESLLDRTFGTNLGFVEVPNKERVQAQAQETTKNTTKLRLSSDKIYQEIKSCHFSFVSQALKAKSRELQATYEKGQSSLADMKDFINKELKDLKSQQKSLALHIHICESIIRKSTHDVVDDFQTKLTIEQHILQLQEYKTCLTYIEDTMLKQPPVASVLGMMCLLCAVQGGIMDKDYDRLKTTLLHMYGFQYLPTFYHLRKMGLLFPKPQTFSSKVFDALSDPTTSPGSSGSLMSGPNWFQAATSKLSLIKNDSRDLSSEDGKVDLKEPTSMSYIFNGVYEPLSCRLIQNTLMGRDHVLEDVVKVIPRATFSRAYQGNPSSLPPTKSRNASRKVLVFFIGGCTYGEIAALRHLSKQTNYQILIATTAIINGSQMLDSLLPNVGI